MSFVLAQDATNALVKAITDSDQLIRVGTAARLANVSRQAFEYLIARNRFDVTRIDGVRFLFHRQVTDYIAGRKIRLRCSECWPENNQHQPDCPAALKVALGAGPMATGSDRD